MKDIYIIIGFTCLVIILTFLLTKDNLFFNEQSPQFAPTISPKPVTPQITPSKSTTPQTTTTPQPIKDVSNSNDLQTILKANSGKLVVLKSYLDTCPICKAYGPTYSKFPLEYPSVVFTQYNAGRPTDLTSKLSLSSVPMTTFYINSNSINQIAGLNIAQIKQTIEAHKNGN